VSLSRSRTRAAGAARVEGSALGSLDPILLLTSIALTVFGVVAVYVAGGAEGQSFALNQGLGFVVGLAGAVPLAMIDYRILQRHLRAIYISVLVMLVAVFFVGVTAGGAQRWVDIGPFQVQPSEFAKLFMVVVFAGYLSRHRAADTLTFLKTLGIVVPPALLVFLQPDLGTALVFGAIFVAMTFTAGARWWQLGGLAALGALGAYLAVRLGVLADYQVARLTAFMDQSGGSEVGYQVAQSKLSIGSGGITGKGLGGETLATLGFLPEDHTDFIFSNLAERMGFVGGLLLIVLFFLLVWRILHIASVSRDRFGVLLAVGIGTIFLFHVFVNIGMTMGIMPVTGIPLPFISYGRSNLVVSLLCLGLLQSIARRARSEAAKSPSLS
jgi:rod shape determining protein RodA